MEEAVLRVELILLKVGVLQFIEPTDMSQRPPLSVPFSVQQLYGP